MTNSNSPDLRSQRRFLPFDDFITKAPNFNTGQGIAREGLMLKSRSNIFSRTLPRILLFLLSCGFLMSSVAALTCHTNCQTCYGQASTECMSCKPSYILQSNACIPSATGCSTGYLLTAADNICRPWVCSANCETCWDVGAANCMSCKPNFILQDYTCIAKVGTAQPYGCSTGYQLDLNDMTCKKTIYDIDNPCNPGTVNLVEGASSVQQCLSCGAGFYCESFGNSIGGSDCNSGHFCQSDSNTRSPIKEYDSVRTLTGGTLFASPVASATNYFIGYDLVTVPNGSQNDICQPGSYSGPKVRRCTSCSGTKFCPIEWMKDETTAGSCRAGFYCVTGCTKPTPNNPLPSFPTIFTTISTTPLTVTTNSGNAIENLESTFSGGVWTSTAGGICPTGSYCTAGVSTFKQCDIGYFLPYQGATSQAQCLLCPAGLYCPTAGFTDPYDTVIKFRSIQSTYFCAAGYVCLGGAAVTLSTPCLQDYYCVTGTRTMVPCQPNEYTVGMRSSSCTACPDGNYCVGQGAQIACGSNQFCKDSVISYCKPGRNSNTPLGSTEAQYCRPCPKGSFCQQPNVLSPCADGFYCISDATGSGAAVTTGYGSLTPRPNYPVSVTNDVLGQNGGVCVPGYFCKTSVSGGDKMIDCTAGQYCSDFGLADTQGQCREGYLCVLKALSPIGNFDGVNFNLSICPPGNFCPQGASVAQPCPAGTYSQSLGAAQSSDCKSCPAGAVCSQSGVAIWPAPAGAVSYCPGGNYCPAGADQTSLDTSKYLCDRGYRCPAGNTIDPTEINAGQKQMLCEAGTYQDQKGQSTCITCPAGQYCDYEDPTQTKQCPAGFFCSGGTKVGNQQPCPSGYYSNVGGKTIGTDCKLCDLGYYCFLTGQQSPTSKIVARYHGNGQTGQVKPNPYLCPVAAYCPEGTGESISCADGQWTSDIGMASVNQCIPCKRGKFCKFATMRTDPASSTRWVAFKNLYPSYTLAQLLSGFSSGSVLLSSYYGDCQSGYICKEGSKTPTPLNEQTDNGYKCPAGYFCQPGFVVEKPCEPGFYNPSLAQGSCQVCPAGQYCPSFAMKAGIVCIAGHYCPAGSIYPNPCPAGTYVPKIGGVDQLGLVSFAVCTQCDASNYCENIGDTQVTGLCAPGFICGPGQDRPGPYATTHNPLIASSNGKCPAKAYCEQGATIGKACADGFYQDGVQQSECFPSPPGKYCSAGNCNLCDFGYYCQGGSKIKNPGSPSAAINDRTGGICPIQNYCNQGAGDPRPCDAGTWQTLTGQFICTTCEKGYLCQGNGIKIPCPAFNYCAGDLAYPFGKLCPGGFYGNKIKTGFYEVKNCTACPATTYCQGGRQSGQCAAGYICNQESDSPTPTNLDLKRLGKAYPCPAGDWCPQGAKESVPCPIGYFTREAGGRQEADCSICPIGYFCDQTYPTPQNCPPGYYCPIGSSEALPCPKGSYNPALNAGGLTDCLPCAAGYTCPESALGNIGALKGKYRCPLGYFCPEGYDNDPIPCIDGSYFDDITHSTKGQGFSDTYVATTSLAQSVTDCKLCPENFYCPQGTGNRYSNPCPSGSICPAGSGAPLLCPPGFYCQNVRGTILKKICPVGYFCPIGTETPHRCQPGTVCIEGSSSEAIRGMTPADCKPGEYLNVDKCFKCEPGFVCDSLTSQKYPINSKTEGGYECPAGSYCPAGTGTSTIKPCPPGTFRLDKIGKSLQDCFSCPNGSVTSSPGSKVCTLCGRGATNNADRTNCQCIGAFRTWLASNNQCVCQTGYYDPTPTQADETSAINLDCKPVLSPFCLVTEFVDEFNKCKLKSSCKNKSLCNGQGDKLGDFDSNTNNCYCKGASNEPTVYCDKDCQNSVLKAYYNNNEQIILQAGKISKTFTFDDFADSIFLDGLFCPKTRCEIMSTQMSNGNQMASGEADQVFVDAWKKYVDPNYISPYSLGKKRVLYANHTTDLYENHRSVRDALRNLQAATLIEKSIQCINQYDAISFSVSQQHFPVYVKDSSFNSEQNYDFSSFDKLKNKLLLSQLDIKSFMVTFKDKGVFAIGDYANPNIVQTLILVTDDVAGKCNNQKQWPLTVENINKLGIKVDDLKLVHFDQFLHVLPVLAVAGAFVFLYAQHFVEKRIEMKELEIRTKRENMVKLKAYFKKKEDRFDKMGYLSDMYKLMQENLDKINSLIAENERLVNEQDDENIRKKLKVKHSIYEKLEKDGKLKQIEKLRADVNDMLDNLRTPDGRTLRELYNQQQLKKKLAEEEARLRAMHEKKKQDLLEQSSQEEETDSLADESDNDSAKDGLKDSFQESEEEKKESDDEFNLEGYANMDPIQQDDWRRIKEEIQKKKKDFEASLDPHLSDDEKATMMRIFNDQMKDLERDLRKEKQNQDQLLQKKLMDRKKKAKKAQRETEIRERDKTDKVTEAQEQINELTLKKDSLEEHGIKTKDFKREREEEFDRKMKEFDVERDKQIKDMREDYLDRIRNTKDGREKERLLEEMGRRMKQVEDLRIEERLRQEATLKKMIKDRQKKNVKKQLKEIDNQIEFIEKDIDKIQQEVDEDKAKAYAEEGATGLIENDVKERKDKISEKLGMNFAGFMNQLNEQEKEDVKIQKSRLQMELEKEIRGAEAQIDDQIDQEALYKLNKLEEVQKEIRGKIKGSMDPLEQRKLLEDLEEVQKDIEFELKTEKRNHDMLLDAKRKKRAQLLQIKKMQIETDQLKEINNKEIELNQKKFDDQMGKMDDSVNAELEKQCRTMMNHEGPNKEQALILINEVEDDLLAKKLKILMSKQFFDLTKYLGTLQSQAGMEHMMRVREIKMAFEKDKQELVDEGINGDRFDFEVNKLRAQMETEMLISAEKMKRDQIEKESELRQVKEKDFAQEKKDLQNISADRKRAKIKDAMDRFPEDKNVQEVGVKLLKRVNNTLTDEIADLEKEREINLEKARLKIIADDQEALAELQKKMAEDMEKAENELENKMKERKQNILSLKKQNLDDRIKMAQGELTDFQIKELRAQFTREYEQLEQVISNEKEKQLRAMRAAMLERRINKERKRKQELVTKRQEEMRNQNENMSSHLASALKDKLKFSMGIENNQLEVVQQNDQLLAKLHAWEKGCQEVREERGGEEGNIWNLQYTKEKEDAEKARVAAQKAEEKKKREEQIDYTVRELLKRIARVEKVSHRLAQDERHAAISNIVNRASNVTKNSQ